MADPKNADATAAAKAKEEALAQAEAEAQKAEVAAAAKQEALEAAAAEDPRPDDLLEVRITGKCTLGVGGIEKIGSVKILPRSRVPTSATVILRTVKRGKKPEAPAAQV